MSCYGVSANTENVFQVPLDNSEASRTQSSGSTINSIEQQETEDSSQKPKALGVSTKIEEHRVAAADGCQLLPVWDFDSGLQTKQNGDYNHFGTNGSQVSLSLVQHTQRGPHGRSLEVSYNKTNNGYCGIWMRLFDDQHSGQNEQYLDVSSCKYLSFWVRGRDGGEDLTVQMADPIWYEKGDSKAAGLVSDYLYGPVTKEWKEVVIPFGHFDLENF